MLSKIPGFTAASVTETDQSNDHEIIPNEMWIHIFSFFQLSTLSSISLVCRKWNQLSNDDLLWKALCYKDFSAPALTLRSPFKKSYKQELEHQRLIESIQENTDPWGVHHTAQQQNLKSRCVDTPLYCFCTITLLAVTILGALAIAGTIGPSLGWIALGLGGALGVVALLGCCTCHPSSFYLLPALYLIVLGALGGTGVLSSVGLGWAMIAPALLGIAVICCGSYGSSATSSCWAPQLFL